MPRAFAAASLALAAALALPAAAAEFRTVAAAAAVAYDAPSDKAKKLYLLPQGAPVEIVSTINRWVKVRDLAGDVFWLDRAELAPGRTVVAVGLVTVRREPRETAEPVLQVERGVMLEALDEPSEPGWLRVRHRDGVAGHVRAADVWGR